MVPFHTQLTAARKAKHLTQEQLAECMNVSRPTVSRWENGHILPDIDTVRRLSALLEFDFIAGHALADAAPIQEPPAAEAPPVSAKEPPSLESVSDQAPPGPARRSFRRYLPYALAIAATVILLLLWLYPQRTAPMQNMQETYYSLDWYRRTQENTDPAQPYLQITSPQNPLKAGTHETLKNKLGWLYEFHLTEVNGMPLTIHSITLSYFHQDGTFRTAELETGDLRKVFMNNLSIYPNVVYRVTGGFPLQDMLGLGIRVEVKDANDQVLTFRYYLELSQEIAS